MVYQQQGSKLILSCLVQPKAAETRVTGQIGDRLKIRLTAAASDGKANRQLIKFLAKEFKVKQNAVSILSGASSRQKRLCIELADANSPLPQFLNSPDS